MPNGGELTVRTSNVAIDENEARKRPPMSPGEYVLLAVSDTGHGIDAGQHEGAHLRAFLHDERGRKRNGSWACDRFYGVVKQSGGFIWVDKRSGQRSNV